ncbi:MAG: DUF2062 domain-containing protein [Akkermansiaceae bacterium]
MKRRYLRIVRKAYRYLRHPQIRNRPWLVALTKPLFDRNLWKPCRSTVASGLSVGLFCAMLPIPFFQMLIAALGCLRAKANIPIAMAACWVTNPFTYAPIVAIQVTFGKWIRKFVHFDIPFDRSIKKTFLGMTLEGSPVDFIVGFLATGVILSILAYPIVYGISAFLPNRGRKEETSL